MKAQHKLGVFVYFDRFHHFPIFISPAVFLFAVAMMLLLSSGVSVQAETIHEFQKLTASDAGAGDLFGRSVSVSGNTAIVGAYGHDYAGLYSGTVYVFTNIGGIWNQTAKLTPSDTTESDYFGFSVSISDDTAIVGAYGNDDNGSNSGSAYIFTKSGDTWIETAKLTASDAARGHWFGFSVSISGDTAIVGAGGNNDAGLASGSAYVFTKTGGIWSQTAKLTASDAAEMDEFGRSVSICGDTAVVGAHGNDDAGSSSGSAYIFSNADGTWIETAKLTASDATQIDEFGGSVSISGDTVIVGAIGNDDNGSNSGSAYVFTNSEDTWNEVAKLTASDATENAYFGSSVSISNNRVLIGAYGNADSGAYSGSAYVFTNSKGTWSEMAKLTASDMAAEDHFGRSVSINGVTMIIGAHSNDDAGIASGSAYLFTVPEPSSWLLGAMGLLGAAMLGWRRR